MKKDFKIKIHDMAIVILFLFLIVISLTILTKISKTNKQTIQAPQYTETR